MTTSEDAIWAQGPWKHREIPANGVRFHGVEMGQGPLVLLLHGFPQFWWTWRATLPALADAGYRAVAVDLRGYGASDHTPHGYDPFTLSADAAALARSLGESSAVLVGHGWGGLIAWSAAVLRASAVRALAPISMPHPNMLRRGILHDPEQRRLSRYSLRFQTPITPERRLLKNDADQVADFLHQWSGSDHWPTPEEEATYRAAFQYGATAHCALEYYRWSIRSIPRPDGRRYAEKMRETVRQPVLHISGKSDGAVLPSTFENSDTFVTGRYERYDMGGVGHFPQEEAPAQFNELLVRWLQSLD